MLRPPRSAFLRTQPQVSRLIQELEAELGFRLFTRYRKRLLPTEEGIEFHRRTRGVLSGYDDIPLIVQDIAGRGRRLLRVGCQIYTAQSLLPQAIAEFSKRDPTFRFSVDIYSRAELGQSHADLPYDIGVVALPIEHSLLIRSEPFALARVVVVLPKDHKLAVKPWVDAVDIAGGPFIALAPSTLLRREIDRMFTDLGILLNIRGEASAGISTCQMVANGLGVTIADPLEAQYVSNEAIAIRELRPSLRFTYGFLYSAVVSPTALMLQLADCIAKTAKLKDPDNIDLISSAKMV